MDIYTISEFWIPRLGCQSQAMPQSLVQGWSFVNKGLSTFVEAPLTLSTEEFGSEADPMHSSVLLVSAPGAVGKSTLARQIAFSTGSVYVDLAKADPVGGHTLSGGLVRSNIYSAWDSDKMSVLIDGLDEAALKTTKEGLEAFLADVAELSTHRAIPTVLFGRTGAIQDAWLVLTEQLGDTVGVFEIGYYTPEESINFAEAQLKVAHPNRQHPAVDREALTLLLQGLRSQTATEGDRFAGYAPVLQAVAEHVGGESNPGRLVNEMQQGIQSTVTLHSVVTAILRREQKKLGSLRFKEDGLGERLYQPQEQLNRLVAKVYQGPPPGLPDMPAEDAETYATALETWVGEHPFLGGVTGTSSVVFQAVISAQALKNLAAAQEAQKRELAKGDAANPFLYVFYTGEEFGSGTMTLPDEHIGVIYSSLRASLARGDTASLLVEESDDDGEETFIADVEIEIVRRGSDCPTLLPFETESIGSICLGPHVKDVTIRMPQARVEIGQSSEVSFVAPVDIQCYDLAILAKRVIVDTAPESETAAVFLQADGFSDTPMTVMPVTRNGAKLMASWPGVDNYPWNSFATERRMALSNDPRVHEGLRRFRKFVIEFRAHGHGGLARSRDKIDSTRMTKGTGQAVLKAMLNASIVTRDQARYYLNTGKLGELTETTYEDCMASQFGPRAIDFVRKALQADEG